MRGTGLVAVVALCAIVSQIAMNGCGNSDSDAPSAQQLASARQEGEEAAREKARIKSLQHQVHHLQSEVRRQGHSTTAVSSPNAAEAEPAGSVGSSVLRVFHAPSGNVSCEILSDGALCSVASIDETFAFSNGEVARVESGAALPEDAGELAPYGSTVSAGSIVCSVPRSNEPRGITCSDSASGHGFEASRVADRQHVY
jgi:hypothetical protein